MPLGASGLKTRSPVAVSHYPLDSLRSSDPRKDALLGISTQIEFRLGERDDSIERGAYIQWQISSRRESLGFSSDRFQRLHEVAGFELAAVVSHCALPGSVV
jgi:hypothetical protein